MGYRNFDAAVYCTVREVSAMADRSDLETELAFLLKHIQVDKVYLETYRGNCLIEREKILKVKEFFTGKGIRTSGGITTDVSGNWQFQTFCYTNPEHLELLQKVVRFTAEIFDEMILDDFFFTNCKCDACIQAKGDRSWSRFRIDLLKHVSEEIVVKTAKAANPNVNVIIKYPNWYDDYQNTGYNLKDEPRIFDNVYTGTETRDPRHTQQTLQRYLSYFVMRYLENVKPGHNGGGWFDTYDCAYNLGSYAEQSYLTLFSKAKEVTLFSLSSLLYQNSIFTPIAGYTFEKADQFLGLLGNPLGISCYKPYHSSGENYLHAYLGMLGLPLEPTPDFPEDSTMVFLTESACHDADIVNRIKNQLRNGKNAAITTGLLKALTGKGMEDIAEICCTGRNVSVSRFAYPMFQCSFGNYYDTADPVLIPQIDAATNDCIPLVVAFADGKAYPILLQVRYGSGILYIVTVPDHFGDLYRYPDAVLNEIRRILTPELPVRLEGPSQVGLFVYNNDTFIVESFLSRHQDIKIVINQPDAALTDLVHQTRLTGWTIGETTEFPLKLSPSTYQVFQINRGYGAKQNCSGQPGERTHNGF